MKAQLAVPMGLRAAELSSPSQVAALGRVGPSRCLGSAVELALKAWVRVSWPRGCENRRVDVASWLLVALGGLTRAVLESLPGGLQITTSWHTDQISYHLDPDPSF